VRLQTGVFFFACANGYFFLIFFFFFVVVVVGMVAPRIACFYRRL